MPPHAQTMQGNSSDGPMLSAVRSFAKEAAASGGGGGRSPLLHALETAAFLGRCPARSPTPEDVRANTLFNAKREREAYAEAAEQQAPAKRRRQRDTRVCFERTVRVRDVEEESEERHAARACAQQDHEVATKLVDGPSLIPHVTSNLLVGISQHGLRDAETIMWTIYTTLLQHGWTSIDGLQELHLLGRTYSNLERLENTLNDEGFVAILPGAYQLNRAMLPGLQQLKLGINQASLRVATAAVMAARQAQEILPPQLVLEILLTITRCGVTVPGARSAGDLSRQPTLPSLSPC